MDSAAGEADRATLRVGFDLRLKLEFHGSRVTSDGGLLAFRELEEALGLTLFRRILGLIDDLRPRPVTRC